MNHKPYNPSPLHGRVSVWLKNVWHWRTAWAVSYLSKQLQRDKWFRDSWHTNIAMTVYDATHVGPYLYEFDQIPIGDCNRVADRLMHHLFKA